MKNWLGQNIEVGSVVYRGSRDGNTSSYKVGRVLDINKEKGTARVHWLLEPAWGWLVERGAPSHSRMDSKGSPSIDSLILIDINPDDYPDWDANDFRS